MNNKSIKNLVVAVALFGIASMFTSCNRGGYGCPYELKALMPTVHICK